jgi:hypothetical protein
MNCSRDPSSSSICSQLTPSARYQPKSSNSLAMLDGYLSRYNLTARLGGLLAELNLLVSVTLNAGGEAAGRAATPGEVAHTLDGIAQAWSLLLRNSSATTPGLTTKIWGIWTAHWSKTALRVKIMDHWSWLRRSNYYFVAAQPDPIGSAGREAMSHAYAALFTHLSGNRNLQYHNVRFLLFC